MKAIILNIITVVILGTTLMSCDDYLSDTPKGQKIPTTFADFEALIRSEYGNHRTDVSQALILLNDRFETSSNLNYYPLNRANYMWDETADRIEHNNSDETAYYHGYATISTCNLLIEHVPGSTEGTSAEKNELVAQAKVLRTVAYFYMVNFYAETYDEATASTKKAIPWITSADIDAPYQQLTIQELYNNMLNDIQEAIPHLNSTSATPLHPNLGAAHALRARIYLQMGKYAQALADAESALGEKDDLYDWTQYYSDYKTQIEDPAYYTRTPSPMGHYYVENYYFRHGLSSNSGGESNIPVERAARFETGDARFAARWKLRTVGSDTYYYGMLSGFFNHGALTTTEVYLIKAECLARAGQYSDAMDVLNKVRKTRILSAHYADLSAATEAQAIEYIRRTKDNEFVLSLTPFADTRRYNKETAYERTLTKTVGSQTYSLSPTSHMWTMVFPMGAIKNPGNGTLTQNVDK